MSAKITLTLTKDKFGTDDGMAQTLALLSRGDSPLNKFVVTIECENEDADDYADDLKRVLTRRPAGVKVSVKVTTEEEVKQEHLATVTPMDVALRN